MTLNSSCYAISHTKESRRMSCVRTYLIPSFNEYVDSELKIHCVLCQYLSTYRHYYHIEYLTEIPSNYMSNHEIYRDY